MADTGRSGAPRSPDDDLDDGGEAVKQVFSVYVSSVNRGRPHPGDIAEASSLSAIPLPPTSYPLFDALPPELVSTGKLSQLQLEGILYACSRHQELLPSGERAGFFIGDGAGVGKGRQIAGCIIDNYARGRRRAVWLSTSSDLHQDATRDLRDLGCHIPVINNLQTLDKETKALGLAKDLQEGVLFITYSTLVSGGKAGRSRLDQIIEWLKGDSFDGLLVFDECHKAKNFVPGKEAQSTKVASAVIELQRRLPKARVLYCSATGVSEVGNTAYMTRMHMWGPGTAFPDFESFLDSMKKRGVSFLEMLAMEMKAAGKYVARGLSFRNAEFLELEAPLAPRQAAMYDAATELWQELRASLERALELTGLPGNSNGSFGGPSSGGGGGSAASKRSDPWKPFWGAHQRFFKSMCVSLKVPTVVEEAKAALLAGQCVVIGLQSTGEAAADAAGLEPGPVAGFVSTTRELLLRFVEVHLPTHREVSAESLANGVKPQPVPECISLKKKLLDHINRLQLPPNFLDQLIDELGGPDAVAEMTGRKGRVVRDRSGRARYELRAKPDTNEMDSLNVKERDHFMSSRKLVAIISDAASTGISLHASREARNQRRRVHLTIELPWSADKAIQQLGRSHRSNQVTAPIYKLVTTRVGGEKRFAAAVARRLQSLGALTRGDRRAASGIDLSEQNFDSPWGRKSLRKMYDHIVQEAITPPSGVSLAALLRGCPEEVKARYAPQLQLPAASAGTSSPRTKPAAAATVPAPASPSARPQLGGASPARRDAAAREERLLQQALAVARLHREFRDCCDIMGIGVGAPRGDTVAEERMTGAASNKDLGDVRRFLNRLLGLPLERQNLLFSYFAATLSAEIAAAKAEGRYSEGVSDLLGSSIALKGPPKVLWSEPGASTSAQSTLVQTLLVDRGVSFDDALRRLEHEMRPGDNSGFRRSRRPMFGAHMLLLALQKPGQRNMYQLVRPNTGDSYFDMDRSELETKYTHITPEAARDEWEAAHKASLAACMHGAHCQVGTACHIGRRQIEVCLLTGSVVRVWGVLEALLEKRAADLPKAERAMRVVRVALGQRGGARGTGESPGHQQEQWQDREQAEGLGQQQQRQHDQQQQQEEEVAGPREQDEQQQEQEQAARQQQQQEEGKQHQQQEEEGKQQDASSGKNDTPEVVPEGYLVGVRYPSQLLPEVQATLASLQADVQLQLQLLASGAAVAHVQSLPSGAAQLRVATVEPPTPVDERSLAKALRAPKTIHDFFTTVQKQGSTQAQQSQQQASQSQASRRQAPQQQQQQQPPPQQQSASIAAKAAANKSLGGSKQQSQSSLPQKRLALAPGQQQLNFGSFGSEPAKRHAHAHAQQQLARQQQKRPASVIVIDSDSAADSRGGSSAVGPIKADPEVASGSTRVFPSSKSAGSIREGSSAAPPGKRLKAGAGTSAAGNGCKQGGKGTGGGGASADDIKALLGMGFGEMDAQRALWATAGNVDRAVEWLLNGRG